MAGRPFSELVGLSPETLEVLAACGFERATPVQEATVPLFAGNKDVAVDAQTGSGKTLAFVLPVVERLRRLEEPLKKHQVGAVVVSPTRELARQILTVAQPFVDSVPWLRASLLVGGTDPAADVAALKAGGAHVLVGTPGRLDDIMQRCAGFLDTKAVEVLVLDEADRLLDMGFKAQLDAIMARLPKQRRTGLFSATQTEAVEALARAGLRNPVRVNVAVTLAQPPPSKKREKGGTAAAAAQQAQQAEAGPEAVQRTPSTLAISYVVCEASQRLPQLAAFLQEHRDQKVIVYFLTCACVDFFAAALSRLAALRGGGGSGSGGSGGSSSGNAKTGKGGGSGGKGGGGGGNGGQPVAIHALHGRMKQAAREATLQKFAEGSSGVLLCTDVAARGLDIPDVHWIVQFDPPQDPAAFVHRVGRTARMGRSGNAVVFLLPHETTYVEFLRIRKVPLHEGQGAAGVDVDGVLAAVRREAETDRLVMEAGTKAFVSYVRAYKEHHCKFIFRLQDLDLGDLAKGFCLLRLPKMPEIKKGKGVEGFVPSSVDPDTVKFKDKAREKQRRAVLKQKEAQRAQQAEQAAAARKAQQQAAAQGPGARLTAAKRRQLEARQELAELNDEYALLRKLKKGKISQHAFDVATGLSSDDDVDMGEAAGAGPSGGQGSHGANGAVAAGDAADGHVAAAAPGQQPAVGGAGKGGGRGGGGGQGAGAGVLLASRDLVGEALAKKQRRQKRKKQKGKAKAAAAVATGGRGAGGGAAD